MAFWGNKKKLSQSIIVSSAYMVVRAVLLLQKCEVFLWLDQVTVFLAIFSLLTSDDFLAPPTNIC